MKSESFTAFCSLVMIANGKQCKLVCHACNTGDYSEIRGLDLLVRSDPVLIQAQASKASFPATECCI